jgi:hypothetical protein
MSVYTHNRLIDKPVRELLLDTTGLLLSCSGPRYDTLDQYTQQFAGPVSSLPGAGVWVFQDVLSPRLRLVVECSEVDWCVRCHQALTDCSCCF